MTSAPAIRAGRYVARAVRADLAGRRPPPFRYRDKGRMATIGHNAAVARLRGGLELRVNRPIRIILQTPPDPIVATLRASEPDERCAAPAHVRGGGRAL